MYSESQSSPCSDTTLPHEDSVCSSWFESVFEASDLVRPLHTEALVSGSGRQQHADSESLLSQWQCISDHADSGGAGVRNSQPPTAASTSDREHCPLYPSQQKIMTAKAGLNSGKQHFTSKGKLREARHLKWPCKENCVRCESPKLTTGERAVIFQQFWSLKSHERQWLFLIGSIECVPPKRKSVKAGTKGERLCSRKYSFLINGGKRRVCKTMFKNTLCICDSWIDSALSHSSESGFVPDMRGKHRRFKAISHS